MQPIVRCWFLVILSFGGSCLFAQDKPSPPAKLALTPPMGWNSWNKFGCNVGEDMIKGMADAMVKSGMKDAGYQYVVIDDCWQVSRDKDGNIVADPLRFLPASRRSRTTFTPRPEVRNLFGCRIENLRRAPGRPRSRYQDALKYASWGVDT
jgi:alpha-galactosidase